jgi:hypothetical protein
VLQRLSHDVLLYLDRADRARERAQLSPNKAERLFHHRMEDSWMNLAASAAFVERVDLFLHTVENSARPYDGCPECRGLMRLMTIESANGEDIFTFECRSCGSLEQRTLARREALATPAQ